MLGIEYVCKRVKNKSKQSLLRNILHFMDALNFLNKIYVLHKKLLITFYNENEIDILFSI
jgi:hypothetical protein